MKLEKCLTEEGFKNAEIVTKLILNNKGLLDEIKSASKKSLSTSKLTKARNTSNVKDRANRSTKDIFSITIEDLADNEFMIEGNEDEDDYFDVRSDPTTRLSKKHKSNNSKKSRISIQKLQEELDLGENKKAITSWKVLLNVIQAIKNMRSISAKELITTEDIDKEIISFEKQKINEKKPNSNGMEPMEQSYEQLEDQTMDVFMDIINKQNIYSKYVAQGDDSHLHPFRVMLMKDPMRNLYGSYEKDKYFINQKTHDDVTYLYIACINGHLNYIQLLLKCDADHLIKCGKPGSEMSVLDAAVKWSHTKVVRYLMTENEFKLDWPYEYICNALKIAREYGNKEIIRILSEEKSKHKKDSKCLIQ